MRSMRDFRDAKAMAQTLRESLTIKAVTISHSESLELQNAGHCRLEHPVGVAAIRSPPCGECRGNARCRQGANRRGALSGRSRQGLRSLPGGDLSAVHWAREDEGRPSTRRSRAGAK